MGAFRRSAVVPVLVIGSLVVAVAVSVALGSDRPYPGVALGSGLLLELERAMAIWAIVLLVLVVSDQALVGRLPDEISGRGVRYTPPGPLDEASDADGDVPERLDELEQAVTMMRRQRRGQ